MGAGCKADKRTFGYGKIFVKSAYRTKSVCENPYNTRYLLVL